MHLPPEEVRGQHLEHLLPVVRRHPQRLQLGQQFTGVRARVELARGMGGEPALPQERRHLVALAQVVRGLGAEAVRRETRLDGVLHRHMHDHRVRHVVAPGGRRTRLRCLPPEPRGGPPGQRAHGRGGAGADQPQHGAPPVPYRDRLGEVTQHRVGAPGVREDGVAAVAVGAGLRGPLAPGELTARRVAAVDRMMAVHLLQREGVLHTHRRPGRRPAAAGGAPVGPGGHLEAARVRIAGHPEVVQAGPERRLHMVRLERTRGLQPCRADAERAQCLAEMTRHPHVLHGPAQYVAQRCAGRRDVPGVAGRLCGGAVGHVLALPRALDAEYREGPAQQVPGPAGFGVRRVLGGARAVDERLGLGGGELFRLRSRRR